MVIVTRPSSRARVVGSGARDYIHRDKTQNSWTVPAIAGRLATMEYSIFLMVLPRSSYYVSRVEAR